MLEAEFLRELEASGYVHAPLPLHEERSLEAELRQKPVLESVSIWKAGDAEPAYRGIGALTRAEDGSLRVEASTAHEIATYDVPPGKRPVYHAAMEFTLAREDWRSSNRLSFWVKPDSDGSRCVHLRVHLRSEGEEPTPEPYRREGSHLANLVNHEWNHVIWEFAALPRDAVTQLRIVMDADGRDTSTGDTFRFDFREIERQRVAHPELERGWRCAEGRIAYSTSGYALRGAKTAVVREPSGWFELCDASGNVALRREVCAVSAAGERFGVLDFSDFATEGRYFLRCGDMRTRVFPVGEKALESSVWKLINFLFCERCGYPVPQKHGRCHNDVVAEHNGVLMSFGGGWHDAGDMSQQSLQTAEVAQEVLELASRVKDAPLLRQRLMEEGLWGLEFVLRTRFGDGYRASSVGLGAWTNGLIGDSDDVKVRVHAQAYQNFFNAAVEAQAALAIREDDRDLAWKCVQTAKEDFRFAQARFAQYGMELPVIWEHTLNSGASQYYAAAAWAAASVCQYEADEEFARYAEDYGARLLRCQERGTEGVPMRGFFYRDERHCAIVHFTHQGRDHSFVQALEALCLALPASPSHSAWEEGMRLYGEYLKQVYAKATPYGMMPAGLHARSEADDRETFPLLHLQVEFEEERDNYLAQLDAGEALGNGYALRQFPVWFSFRGNSAMHLGMGKAAALLGRYFGDRELTEMGRAQLYWMAGRNPFCQSLMYGEGERYAQQDANYPGEMTGEVPVGVQTRANEDCPYWPAGNNATYKEVWLTPAGRWLSIAAELYPEL